MGIIQDTRAYLFFNTVNAEAFKCKGWNGLGDTADLEDLQSFFVVYVACTFWVKVVSQRQTNRNGRDDCDIS